MPHPSPPSNGVLTAAYLAASAAYINDLERKIPLLVRKTIDESISASSTFQDDNELVVAVDASSTYWCQLHVQTNSNVTADFKYQFTKPSGATTPAWNALYYTSAAVLAFSITGDTLTTGGFAADLPIEAWGYLVTSTTAGQFTFQWAQAVSDAGATTVRAGSALILTKIA